MMDIVRHIQSDRGIVSVSKKYSKKEATAKGYEFYANTEDGHIYDKWTKQYHLFALVI